MKRKLLLSMLPLVLMAALTGSSCESSKKQSESTPTQPAIPATASATYEGDIDGVIRQLFWDYVHVKDVGIDRKIYYADSSGTDWIRFDVDVTAEVFPAGPQPGGTGPVYGFMKKVPGENWRLVGLGTGDIQCGVPADVQTGLGFAVCSASEEELNNAIKDFVLENFVLGYLAPTAEDVRISRKAYYTDSSGTDWVEFKVLPIRNLTDPAYGFMRRAPGGNWVGVGGPGTSGVECGLPVDVQAGLGFAVCQPDASATASAASGQDVDRAIRDYVLSHSAPSIKDIRIDKKTYYTDSSGTTWVAFHLYPLPEGVTDPAYGFMKKVPGGNWDGVTFGTGAGECVLPADVQTGLGFAYCPPQPQ